MGMKIIYKWEHKLADGTIIGEIVRYLTPESEKVDIPHYTPGKSCFEKGIPEALKPYQLFGLDNYKNPDELLLVVEGQKVQAALAGLGLQTITSILGASNAASSDWSPTKQAKNIYLLPDNDEPGEGYIKGAYDQIRSHGNGSLTRISRLPNLKDKGDAVNWLQQQPELTGWDGYQPLDKHPAREVLRERLHKEI